LINVAEAFKGLDIGMVWVGGERIPGKDHPTNVVD